MTTDTRSDLRTLDPVTLADLSAADLELRERTLSSILTSAPSHKPSNGRRNARPWLIGLPVAAACALTVGLVISALPGAASTSPVSYALPAHGSLASWTPQPMAQIVSPADLDACESAIGISSDDEASVLTSERRGDFTSLILHAGSTDAFCVLAGGDVVNWTNFAGLRAHPLTDPNEASLSVMQGADWMITVSGRAGGNVTGVNVHNPDTGADVTATIAGGVWSAWWPITADSRANSGLFGEYGDEITITYTTSDGASHTSSGYSDSGEPSDVGDAVPPTLGSLAGWSALPTTYAASAADVDACLASKDLAGVTSPISLVLAERRGDFVTLVLTHESSRAYCTLRDGAVQWSLDNGVVTVDTPTAEEAFVTDGSGFDGKVPGTRISALRGVAGNDVVAVVVHLAEGRDVTATVENGIWLAWWPENEPAALSGGDSSMATATADAPAPAGIPAISFTTADGVTHDAP